MSIYKHTDNSFPPPGTSPTPMTSAIIDGPGVPRSPFLAQVLPWDPHSNCVLGILSSTFLNSLEQVTSKHRLLFLPLPNHTPLTSVIPSCLGHTVIPTSFLLSSSKQRLKDPIIYFWKGLPPNFSFIPLPLFFLNHKFHHTPLKSPWILHSLEEETWISIWDQTLTTTTQPFYLHLQPWAFSSHELYTSATSKTQYSLINLFMTLCLCGWCVMFSKASSCSFPPPHPRQLQCTFQPPAWEALLQHSPPTSTTPSLCALKTIYTLVYMYICVCL